ncbi:MAG: hypothetical protein HYV07_16455 [Deltaproteobacteria bacterium]|nr:hypothetical protein [Deltaproteobacteria bacterium]
MELALETDFEARHPLRRAEIALHTGRLVRIASAGLMARSFEDAFSTHEDLPPRRLGQDLIAAAATGALELHDWIIAGPRELSAVLYRGVPLESVAASFLGTRNDPQLGHVVPGHVPDRERRILPAYSSTGAFLTHAAGLGWAMRLAKSTEITLCFADATRASEADVHTGLNFAGVFEARAVFLVTSSAEATHSFARRAVAYGLASSRVDGSDVSAIAEVTSEAVARARTGGGATIIDVVLTADPMERLKSALGPMELEAIRSRAVSDVEHALAKARTDGPPPRSAVAAQVTRASRT